VETSKKPGIVRHCLMIVAVGFAEIDQAGLPQKQRQQGHVEEPAGVHEDDIAIAAIDDLCRLLAMPEHLTQASQAVCGKEPVAPCITRSLGRQGEAVNVAEGTQAQVVHLCAVRTVDLDAVGAVLQSFDMIVESTFSPSTGQIVPDGDSHISLPFKCVRYVRGFTIVSWGDLPARSNRPAS